jgi:uncharacterized protein YjgD (DUF1641 family)
MNEIQRTHRTDTLRLTQEFNERFFKESRKSIEITDLTIILDDIKNYRTLTDIQLNQLENLTPEERLKVIKVYNTMFSTLENLFTS